MTPRTPFKGGGEGGGGGGGGEEGGGGGGGGGGGEEEEEEEERRRRRRRRRRRMRGRGRRRRRRRRKRRRRRGTPLRSIRIVNSECTQDIQKMSRTHTQRVNKHDGHSRACTLPTCEHVRVQFHFLECHDNSHLRHANMVVLNSPHVDKRHSICTNALNMA